MSITVGGLANWDDNVRYYHSVRLNEGNILRSIDVFGRNELIWIHHRNPIGGERWLLQTPINTMFVRVEDRAPWRLIADTTEEYATWFAPEDLGEGFYALRISAGRYVQSDRRDRRQLRAVELQQIGDWETFELEKVAARLTTWTITGDS